MSERMTMSGVPAQQPGPEPGPLTLHGLDVEGVNRCVHCGLCLASCPTFAELGTEMDSPRGRIFTIKSLAEGRISLSDSAVAHLDLCLGCRACETVCPAGVPYGQLIEAARAEIERQRPGGPLRRLFRWLNFTVLLPSPRLLGAAAAGLRFYQASGLRRLARASGLLRLLPHPLSRGSRSCRSCRPVGTAPLSPSASRRLGRGGARSGSSPGASSRSPSDRRTGPPRASSPAMALRSWCRGTRPAVGRFTPTRVSTTPRSPWPGGPSRPSSAPGWTTWSSTPRAAAPT